MSEYCNLCQEWIDESFDDHLLNDHNPESVEQVYPERYDALYDADGESRPETDQRGTNGGGVTDAGPPGGQDDSADRPGGAGQSGEPDARSDDAADQPGGDGGQSGSPGEQGAQFDDSVGQQDTGAQPSESGPTTDEQSEPRPGTQGSPAGSGETRRADDETDRHGSNRSQRESQSGSAGEKWLMIGIGGAGNNIMDALLMRRDTLKRSNDPLGQVWDQGLAGYAGLNSNINELTDTYYAQIDREFSKQQLLQNSMIAYTFHNHQGAGRRWQVGRRLMQVDFEDERNAIRDRYAFSQKDIEASQAVMLIHSVTKGTGCGATPVLAENIRDMTQSRSDLLADVGVSKPILSSVVLPSADEFGSNEMVRGAVGMSYLSEAVDGIIPFDNEQLGSIQTDLEIEIDESNLKAFNPPDYVDINKLIVAFLEAFTMSSTPNVHDEQATESINGETLDVPDIFRPVEGKYPADDDREFRPAVVMAPVLGRLHGSSFEPSKLDLLVRNALLQGQLTAFDPGTAWGGTFMIYGPEDKMDEVMPLVNTGELKDILGREEFLDRGSTHGGETVDIYTSQLVVPHLDGVYLWGLVWNPKMPSLEKMYQETKRLKEQANSDQAETLRDRWHMIEPLFSSLGRENMG
jgi:hypothetical protein